MMGVLRRYTTNTITKPLGLQCVVGPGSLKVPPE